MVSSTSIFTRGSEGGRQILIYGISVVPRADVAMILPLPVPPGSAADAVRFIDLDAYPDFFDGLEPLFEVPIALGMAQTWAAAATLAVHHAGAFEASCVPSFRDWHRLDARFPAPAVLFDAVPAYRTDGFAVFKLAATGATRKAPRRGQHEAGVTIRAMASAGRSLTNADDPIARKSGGLVRPERNCYYTFLRGRREERGGLAARLGSATLMPGRTLTAASPRPCSTHRQRRQSGRCLARPRSVAGADP